MFNNEEILDAMRVLRGECEIPRLSDRYLLALQLRVIGYTFKEIGERLRVGVEQARHIVAQAEGAVCNWMTPDNPVMSLNAVKACIAQAESCGADASFLRAHYSKIYAELRNEPGRCGYCGGRIVEGDEVHPGYDGWPCCEDCKAV